MAGSSDQTTRAELQNAERTLGLAHNQIEEDSLDWKQMGAELSAENGWHPRTPSILSFPLPTNP